MIQHKDLENAVREVSDEEVAFYDEHGWVKLDGLIHPDIAAELLEAGKKLKSEMQEILEASGSTPDEHGRLSRTTDICTAHWDSFFFHARHIRQEPFLPFILSRGLGRAAHRLINRAALTDAMIPVRYAEDALLCKSAAGMENSKGIGYHQDGGGIGADRVGFINIWIALDDVTPEQGPMRFLDRSHRAGPLGKEKALLLDRYPKLSEQYPWTPPIEYKAGDATAHHELMVHGSPENTTSRPRWAYSCAYIPDDCIIDLEAHKPLMLGMPEPHERFPVVYP